MVIETIKGIMLIKSGNSGSSMYFPSIELKKMIERINGRILILMDEPYQIEPMISTSCLEDSSIGKCYNFVMKDGDVYCDMDVEVGNYLDLECFNCKIRTNHNENYDNGRWRLSNINLRHVIFRRNNVP